MRLHNKHYCAGRIDRCLCLSCIHDKHVDEPEIETKCCDLAGHQRKCTDTFRCPDFEPENPPPEVEPRRKKVL